MHRYMQAAGFIDFDESALYKMIWQRIVQPEYLTLRLMLRRNTFVCEYRRPLSEHTGICAVVLFIGTEFRELQYYYPYFDRDVLSSESPCILERYTENENYAGILDESNLGISVIFFVNNSLDFKVLSLKGVMNEDTEFKGVSLSAFANEGIVILPVEESAAPEENDSAFSGGQIILNQSRDDLLDAALSGDEEALESLTESDIINFKKLTDRIETEDLYSVINQSFMPCGVECDQYSIIGEIKEVKSEKNCLTGQDLWLLDVSCNDINFDLCIRKEGLTGEPLAGRRIKCRIWMQGKVDTAG